MMYYNIQSYNGKVFAMLDYLVQKVLVSEEEIEAALEVICRQNNMSLEMLKPHIDEEFTAAVTRSILMGKVMRLIRDSAEITETVSET